LINSSVWQHHESWSAIATSSEDLKDKRLVVKMEFTNM